MKRYRPARWIADEIIKRGEDHIRDALVDVDRTMQEWGLVERSGYSQRDLESIESFLRTFLLVAQK